MTGLLWVDPVLELLPALAFFAASLRSALCINRQVKRFRALKRLPQR